MTKLKYILLLCCAAFAYKAGNTQIWKPVGDGFQAVPVAAETTATHLVLAFSDSVTSGNGNKIFTFARWDGQVWQTLPGFTAGKNSFIKTITYYKNKLYAGGYFDTVFSSSSRTGVVKMEGKRWKNAAERRPSDMEHIQVNSLVVSDSDLYAGGVFEHIDTTRANGIARYKGAKWEALNSIQSDDFTTAEINHFVMVDDTLFAAGSYKSDQGNKYTTLFKITGNNKVFYDSLSPFTSIVHLEAGPSELVAYGKDAAQQSIIYSLQNGAWLPKMKGFPNIGSAVFTDAEYFNGELWTSGSFNIGAGGNNSLIKWVDTSWVTIDNLDIENARWLKALNNRLFVAGDFDNYKGVKLNHVAEFENSMGIITGRVWLDINNNCKLDAGEKLLPKQVIKLGNGAAIALTDDDGVYSFVLPKTATYQVSAQLGKYWSLSSCNVSSYQFTFGVDDIFDSVDFALQVNPAIEDVAIKILPNSGSTTRKNFTELYTLSYINNGGKTIASGKIKLKLDDSLSNFSANPAPSQMTGNVAEWNFFNLGAGELREIVFSAKNSSQISTIELFAEASSINDAYSSDNFDSLAQSVTNDSVLKGKYIFPEPAITDSVTKISVQDNLDVEYLIRFENTTADTINTVVIIDTIDLHLAIEYIQEMGSSHPYTTQVVNCPPALGKGVLIWTFENINLLPNPGNDNDFIANRGHIRFKIKLNPSTPLGTLVKNQANVMYDFTASSQTNAVFCVLDGINGVNEVTNTGGGLLYPNPAKTYFNIQLPAEAHYTVEITDMQGRNCLPGAAFYGNSTTADVSALSPGIYFISVRSPGNTYRCKLVKE